MTWRIIIALGVIGTASGVAHLLISWGIIVGQVHAIAGVWAP
jgi:hypothetical protein